MGSRAELSWVGGEEWPIEVVTKNDGLVVRKPPYARPGIVPQLTVKQVAREQLLEKLESVALL